MDMEQRRDRMRIMHSAESTFANLLSGLLETADDGELSAFVIGKMAGRLMRVRLDISEQIQQDADYWLNEPTR